MDFSGRSKASAAALEEELVGLMRDAVGSRMIADVPLGEFLSGGVDSSAVVALMSEKSRHPVKTCSIGFDQASLDETGYAEQVRSEEHTSELQSRENLVCRLLLE